MIPFREPVRALYQRLCRAGNSMPPDCIVQFRFAAVPADSLSSRWYSGASARHAKGGHDAEDGVTEAADLEEVNGQDDQ